MPERLTRLRKALGERGLDAMLVTDVYNAGYLSGFTGDHGALLVTPERQFILVGFIELEQARREAAGFEVIQEPAGHDTLAQALAPLVKGLHRLGFEGDTVTYDTFGQLSRLDSGIELVPAGGLVQRIREVKDDGEVAAIRKAAAITDAAFDHILRILRPGMTEEEAAFEIEFFMRRAGAQKLAFDIIVASGERSALPHGRASRKAIEPGDLVTLDIGCVYDGYCSDLTRTVVMGEPTEQQREIYEIVLEAERKGVAAVRAGVSGREVDAACRDIIAGRGYGKEFGHSTGHGVGREVHEGPRLSRLGERTLEPGMVVTVEPGIYIPGWGGVRIEDLVLVTEGGCEVLSKSPRDLVILE